MGENERMSDNERLAKLEVQTERNTKDIKEIKAESKIIHEIATSVQVMAIEMKTITGQLSGVKSDVVEVKSQIREVKNEEGNRSKNLINGLKEKILWVFVGGIALYIFNLLFPFMK